MEILQLAHRFAEQKYGDYKIKFTNRPYLRHLEETAQLLWEYTDGNAPYDEYIAAIFHDIVENTSTTLDEIGQDFGGKTMGIVIELTNNNTQMEIEGRDLYLAKKINNLTEEAFTIKLCSRLSNVVELENIAIPNYFVKTQIKNTQYIFEQLNRTLSDSQQSLISRIESMLMFLQLKRNL
jgi:(p)ppGpp synthase/HD superfamily hydrolase